MHIKSDFLSYVKIQIVFGKVCYMLNCKQESQAKEVNKTETEA